MIEQEHYNNSPIFFKPISNRKKKIPSIIIPPILQPTQTPLEQLIKAYKLLRKRVNNSKLIITETSTIPKPRVDEPSPTVLESRVIIPPQLHPSIAPNITHLLAKTTLDNTVQNTSKVPESMVVVSKTTPSPSKIVKIVPPVVHEPILSIKSASTLNTALPSVHVIPLSKPITKPIAIKLPKQCQQVPTIVPTRISKRKTKGFHSLYSPKLGQQQKITLKQLVAHHINVMVHQMVPVIDSKTGASLEYRHFIKTAERDV